MNTRYAFAPDSLCDSFSSAVAVAGAPTHGPPPSLLIRTAIRISRARWFSFLRRVYHHQNGTGSDLASNPFNSTVWIVLELIALLVQISIISFTLAISTGEKPIWPMRMWIIGYNLGCVLSLVPLFGRIRITREDAFSPSVMEQHVELRSRGTHLMNKCRTCLELLFAVWFVMGNVWVFDARFGSFQRAPKLHVLCISLLGWNALCYSFPFLLFLLLCCCVPLISSLLGYNMNMGSVAKGASHDQISDLPYWKYSDLELGKHSEEDAPEPECCICLAKYKDGEEVRQLPCSHMFHLKCVDQWLRIISCCPLCKKGLER